MRRSITRHLAALTIALTTIAGGALAAYASAPILPRDVHTVSRAYALDFPACRQEDGSRQRPTCLWDARKRGNGTGRSYLSVSPRLPGNTDDRIVRLANR
jgi:hypothetical protein